MEVDDDGKDQDCCQQVHQIGQVLTVEGFTQCADLIVACGQEVEQGDDSTFEFGASTGVDRRGTERFPDDGLADVRGDEQRDTGTETVALLQQFIEQENDQTSHEQLNDDQKANTRTDVRWVAVPNRTDQDPNERKAALTFQS